MRRPVNRMNSACRHRSWNWFSLSAARSRRCALGAAWAVLVLSGCGADPAQFSLNLVHLHAKDGGSVDNATPDPELDDAERKNIANAIDALFGTPDAPRLPQAAEGFLELSKIQRAAGPTGRDDPQGGERGLYRKHCVHCHGINGDGAGPTAAFLNPYPRDYRMGLFKFKSTAGPKDKPTHDDLKRILFNGIPGTAMPSFKVLDDGELEALVHYVKYLAMRGQTERELVASALLADDGLFLDPQKPDSQAFRDNMSELLEKLGGIAKTWTDAQSSEVPPPPADWEGTASIERGRKLFMTKGLCHQCHGVSALGDANRDLFDSWTEDFMLTTGIKNYLKIRNGNATAGEINLLDEFYARGALPVRPLKPRNLRRGVYRGGRRPVDLFRRVRNGIQPMPNAQNNEKGLLNDEVWHVVAYVRSLPFESITEPTEEIRFQRDLP